MQNLREDFLRIVFQQVPHSYSAQVIAEQVLTSEPLNVSLVLQFSFFFFLSFNFEPTRTVEQGCSNYGPMTGFMWPEEHF